MKNVDFTYDWTSIPLELDWKFSVYDISMELPLDYSLHPRDNDTRYGKWRFSEKDLINLALKTSYEDEPAVTCNLMAFVMWNTDCEHKKMYNEYVLRAPRKYYFNIPSMMTFELGLFVLVIFNMHGPWPAIHRKCDLDESNYLTYNHKDANVFIWDNYNIVRGDY